MLSQMDPALVSYCDKIAAQAGPMHLPDDMAGVILLLSHHLTLLCSWDVLLAERVHYFIMSTN